MDKHHLKMHICPGAHQRPKNRSTLHFNIVTLHLNSKDYTGKY